MDHSFFGIKIDSKPKIRAEIYQEAWKAAKEIADVDVPKMGHFDKEWVNTKDGKAYVAAFKLVKKLYEDKATMSYADRDLHDAFNSLIASENNPQLKVAMIANRASYVEEFNIKQNFIGLGVEGLGTASLMYITGRLPANAARTRNAAFTGGQLASSTARQNAINFSDDAFTSFITKEKMTVYRVW